MTVRLLKWRGNCLSVVMLMTSSPFPINAQITQLRLWFRWLWENILTRSQFRSPGRDVEWEFLHTQILLQTIFRLPPTLFGPRRRNSASLRRCKWINISYRVASCFGSERQLKARYVMSFCFPFFVFISMFWFLRPSLISLSSISLS